MSPGPETGAVAAPHPSLAVAAGSNSPRRRGRARPIPGGPAAAGAAATAWLTLIVVLPLAAVVVRSLDGGFAEFAEAVTQDRAVSALKLTLISSVVVAAVGAVMGTVLAWLLVRDEFPGKRVVNALIDLPFALPTIVAGLTLLALYGPGAPTGIDIAYTKAAVIAALLFVTLPFVVRAVQPVLMALDREAEEAAATLGASRVQVFRRVILPALRPAILAGSGLAFGRAVGEFGSIVLVSGNLPNQTEVAPVYIYGQVESGDVTGAAAVSVVLLVVSFVILAVVSTLSRRAAR